MAPGKFAGFPDQHRRCAVLRRDAGDRGAIEQMRAPADAGRRRGEMLPRRRRGARDRAAPVSAPVEVVDNLVLEGVLALADAG